MFCLLLHRQRKTRHWQLTTVKNGHLRPGPFEANKTDSFRKWNFSPWSWTLFWLRKPAFVISCLVYFFLQAAVIVFQQKMIQPFQLIQEPIWAPGLFYFIRYKTSWILFLLLMGVRFFKIKLVFVWISKFFFYQELRSPRKLHEGRETPYPIWTSPCVTNARGQFYVNFASFKITMYLYLYLFICHTITNYKEMPKKKNNVGRNGEEA